MDKRDAAKALYLEGWKQSRIALTLGVKQATVSNWRKKYNWDADKIKKATIMQDSIDKVWQLIDYQTSAMDALREEYLKNSEEKGEPLKLIDKGHLDALQKLFTIVKSKDIKWMDILKNSGDLLEYVQSKDLKLAKKLAPFVTEFIEKKRTDE